MPDHVHLFVCVGPTDAPAQVVRAFKGRTARVLRAEFPYLRNRAKVLWSPSLWAMRLMARARTFVAGISEGSASAVFTT